MQIKNSLIKLYLPFSIRIIAYCSVVYFTKITEFVSSDLIIKAPYISGLIFLLQILVFELVIALVRYKYKPTFVEGNVSEKSESTGIVVLSKDNYNFRYRLEIYILSLAIYCMIEVIVAVLVLRHLSTWNANGLLIKGILGFVASVANFFGFVIFIAEYTPKEGSFLFKIFGLIGMIIGWFYVYYSFVYLELNILSFFY